MQLISFLNSGYTLAANFNHDTSLRQLVAKTAANLSIMFFSLRKITSI